MSAAGAWARRRASSSIARAMLARRKAVRMNTQNLSAKTLTMWAATVLTSQPAQAWGRQLGIVQVLYQGCDLTPLVGDSGEDKVTLRSHQVTLLWNRYLFRCANGRVDFTIAAGQRFGAASELLFERRRDKLQRSNQPMVRPSVR